jgi:hypothetical protein
MENEEQIQEYVHNFLGIHPSRPNSQLLILMQCFMVTMWKCVRTSPRTLATKEVLLHHDNSLSHTSFFTREFLTKNNMTIVPHPPYFSLVSPFEDKTERPPFWHNWGDQSRLKTNNAYVRKRNTSRVLVANRSKVSFDQMGSTSVGNYGWIFIQLLWVECSVS